MITVYTLDSSEQWDCVVKSVQKHDVYYLSGYVKAFCLNGDGEPLLFFYEGQGVRGINVVMRRDIAKDPKFVGKLPENTWFDHATPYGYGGWLLEGEGDPGPLFAAYEQWCRTHQVVSEFVRLHPVLQNHVGIQEAYETVPLGPTVAMDLTSPETVWENLTSKNRNKVRKAQKNGIQIHIGQNAELYEVFRLIYNSTMDKDNAAEYYYFAPAFYESIRTDLPENARIFYATVPDGTVIAAAIMLWENGYMSYHLSGSLQEYQSLAPTNLLLYEAALWGGANGCRKLHLGGGVGSGEDSLLTFKKGFYRGDLCRFHIGKKVFIQQAYEELCSYREDLPESGFFPRYRA